MNVAEGIYIEKSGNRMERSYQKIQKSLLALKNVSSVSKMIE